MQNISQQQGHNIFRELDWICKTTRGMISKIRTSSTQTSETQREIFEHFAEQWLIPD